MSTTSTRPADFAAQLNVSLANGWGIVRTVADMCMKQPEGKYVLVKDPNKVRTRLLVCSSICSCWVPPASRCDLERDACSTLRRGLCVHASPRDYRRLSAAAACAHRLPCNLWLPLFGAPFLPHVEGEIQGNGARYTFGRGVPSRDYLATYCAIAGHGLSILSCNLLPLHLTFLHH